ncbi:cyclic nucleotide-binding domain-containing protein [Kitasatospora cinereorecta]|uniref:Crp/Fnr family transcriptional regulator n=1 Tax=Kitasatospora cinereorecta TaxID=285560 RepID=A0ABW0V281_9ACTN
MTALLAGLAADHRDRLLALGRDVAWADGARIFEEGGPADRFWLVRSGLVALDVHAPGRGTLVVETLGEGELLGWSWLFEPYRWQLGAVARGVVDAIEFDAAAVRAAMDDEPAFGLELLRLIGAGTIGPRLHAARTRLLDLYGGGQDTAGTGPAR